MRKHGKKILFLLLCSFLLLQCLIPCAFAAASDLDELDPDENPYRDGTGCIIWSYNSETDTVRGLGREYMLYTPAMNIYFDAAEICHFENEISIPSWGEDELLSYSFDPEILHAYYTEQIYVTEKGRVSLDALQNGEAAAYCVEEQYGISAPLEFDFAKELKNGTETQTLDVTMLKTALEHKIVGYDGTGAYACVYGGVYYADDAYYYIHYMTLENQFFDADGNFSYRRGTVEGIRLTDRQVSTLFAAAENGSYRVSEHTYEGEDSYVYDEDSAIAVFIVGAVILGFLFPLPFLIVGICMARSRKRGYPKYWYALTAAAAAWMVTALILMVVLL